MRHFSVLIFLFVLQIAAAPFLRAESNDPSELFLSAYMAVQNGQKMEDDGKFKLALQKYRYAVSLLDQIHDKSPDWQPLIVDYRKRKTMEAISKVQQKIEVQGSGATQEPEQPPLPQKSENSTPSLSVSPGNPPQESGAMNPTPAPAATTATPGGADAFENATREMREKFEQMQAELNATKQKYIEVQREKEELAGKLDQSVKQLDQSRVNETELKSQLAQAEDAYKNSIADKTRDSEGQKQLKEEVARLQNALKDAQAERDVAEDTNEETTQTLKSQLSQVEEAYKNEIANKTKDSEGQKQLKDEVTRLQNALKDAQAERDVARDANDQVAQKLKGVISERELALKQRDEALDSLAKAKQGQQQLDKLMAENSTLMQKLNDAEKTISEFNATAPAKDTEIAALKKDLNETREKLSGALKQSQENLNAMNDLQSQLETATSELSQVKAGAVSAEENKKVADENTLLRNIVMRERKEEAHRDQEKKLALAELQRMHVQSDTLVQKINYLGQPVVKLTDQERALFKQPQIAISDADISIAVQKPEETPGPAPVASVPAITVPTPQAPQSTPNPTGNGALAPTKPTTPSVSTSASTVASSPFTTSAENKSDADYSGPHVQTSLTPPVPAELVTQANDAKEQFERGHYREAEKTYTAMLTQEPKNIYILSNLGVVRFRSGKLKSAEETFRKAIAIAPDDAFSHCTLGIVYYSQGKFDEAVGELTKALAIQPKNQTAHNYLGITASAKGWQEAARKELESAIEIDPNYSDAHFNLAVIYLTTPPIDKEAAKKHYKRALELGSEPDAALEQLLNK
jgi:Flp pilus assembly protein TadD